MIYLLNNNSEVVDNFLLTISKLKVKRYNDINSKIIQIEFNFMKSLLRNNCIKEYILSFPSDNIPNLFSLTCNSLLYDQKYTNENAYII